jgi:hypothetical protein
LPKNFYQFEAIRCAPFLVQRPDRRSGWAGIAWPRCGGVRGMAMAGTRGAIAAMPLPPEEMVRKMKTLKRLTAEAGWDFSTLTISCKAPLYDVALSGPDGGRRRLSGSAAEIAGDVREFAGIGVDELIFDFGGETLAGSLERMERFAGGHGVGWGLTRRADAIH